MVIALVLVSILVCVLAYIAEKNEPSNWSAVCGIGVILGGITWIILAVTIVMNLLVMWLTN